ncbi:MAG: dephospho-CoA kinase [Planctomycetota bacterium]
MIVIGLVGRIGAGKSTVARRFAEHGAAVVDADLLAHEALDEPGVVAAIAERFGTGVVEAAGRIDRSRLAREVFGPAPRHAAALEALEAIVHPRVRLRVVAAIAGIRARAASSGRPPAVVLDVPLLVQAGWDGLCTHLVVVDCEPAVRRARLAARGWSDEQIAARDRAWERGFRAPAAGPTTWSVDASGNPSYTWLQVDRIWRNVVEPQGSPPA